MHLVPSSLSLNKTKLLCCSFEILFTLGQIRLFFFFLFLTALLLSSKCWVHSGYERGQVGILQLAWHLACSLVHALITSANVLSGCLQHHHLHLAEILSVPALFLQTYLPSGRFRPEVGGGDEDNNVTNDQCPLWVLF